MVGKRTAGWAMTATTADLLWHSHLYQQRIRAYRHTLCDPDLTECQRATYLRALDVECTNFQVVVAELLARGHGVQMVDGEAT